MGARGDQMGKKHKSTFWYEMAIGVLVVIIGVLVLVIEHFIPGLLIVRKDLVEKAAFAFLTIGGTVFSSGWFRNQFAERVDEVERILSRQSRNLRLKV